MARPANQDPADRKAMTARDMSMLSRGPREPTTPARLGPSDRLVRLTRIGGKSRGTSPVHGDGITDAGPLASASVTAKTSAGEVGDLEVFAGFVDVAEKIGNSGHADSCDEVKNDD
jgi:hypothetical protein